MPRRENGGAATDPSRRIRVLLYGLAVVLPVALFWGFGSMLPPGVEIAARGDVQAPREVVFDLLARTSGMERWADWAKDRTPGLSGGALAGPDRGVGAAWGWDLDGEPWGSMRVAAVDPPGRVVYDVDYRGQRIRRTLTLTAAGATTEIAWSDEATIERPTHRWMAIVMDERAEDEIRLAIRAIDRAARAEWTRRQEAP